MTEMTPRTIVERMFSVEMAFLNSDRKDLRPLTRAFAVDVLVREPQSLPYRGDWAGIEGIAELMARMNDVWSDMSIDELDVAGSQGRIYLSCKLTVVSRASGKTVTQPFCERLHFRDGLLVEGIPFYYDTQALLDVIAEN
jgi:ketosteroid isomerase-like protein